MVSVDGFVEEVCCGLVRVEGLVVFVHVGECEGEVGYVHVLVE